jgi:hypothetical protein
MKTFKAATVDIECNMCGVPFRTLKKNVINGRTKSCGCNPWKTHGMRNSREYSSWRAMWERVSNSHNIAYQNYGGRGIEIHPEWGKFENFYRDMGSRPIGMSLDRINNDYGYEMNNCRWTTQSEQAKNRRECKRKVNGTYA